MPARFRESTDFFAADDELVASALRFIAANRHLPIGPEHVARDVATETRTLQRRLRKYLDRPIATEIRRVRIERAKRELTQSDRPLATIVRGRTPPTARCAAPRASPKNSPPPTRGRRRAIRYTAAG